MYAWPVCVIYHSTHKRKWYLKNAGEDSLQLRNYLAQCGNNGYTLITNRLKKENKLRWQEFKYWEIKQRATYERINPPCDNKEKTLLEKKGKWL